MKEQLLTYYVPSQLPVDEQFRQLTNLKIKTGDKVHIYFNTIMEKTDKLDLPESQEIALFKRGLPKYIKTCIKQEKPKGLLETLRKAKEAEELGSD